MPRDRKSRKIPDQRDSHRTQKAKGFYFILLEVVGA